jgi:hypothetical protein
MYTHQSPNSKNLYETCKVRMIIILTETIVSTVRFLLLKMLGIPAFSRLNHHRVGYVAALSIHLSCSLLQLRCGSIV